MAYEGSLNSFDLIVGQILMAESPGSSSSTTCVVELLAPALKILILLMRLSTLLELRLE
jgi:hypothetical protein